MTRLLSRKVEVVLDDGKLRAFIDADTFHLVSDVADRWVEVGDWWNGERERVLYRVITADEGIFELEQREDGWFLYKVWD